LGAVGGGGAASRADTEEAGRELVATAAGAGGGLAPGAEADRATGGGVATGGLSLSLNRGDLRFWNQWDWPDLQFFLLFWRTNICIWRKKSRA
jgi:hypothetical protein